MAQYINKAALVAEIARLQDTTMDEDGNFYTIKAQAEYNVLCMLDSFLDTLEVKKEVDLYEELDVYFAQFKGLEKSYWNWRIDSVNIHAQGIYDFAKHFYELGLKAQKGE